MHRGGLAMPAARASDTQAATWGRIRASVLLAGHSLLKLSAALHCQAWEEEILSVLTLHRQDFFQAS